MRNQSSELLHPETQKEFWRHIDPSVAELFSTFEAQENWTYKYDEMPELFIETAKSLPDIAEFPMEESTQQVAHQLIRLLASVPLRECLFAIAWLDSQDNEGSVYWGEACYLEAERLISSGTGDDIIQYANILSERVEIINKSRLTISLFSNIKNLEDSKL